MITLQNSTRISIQIMATDDDGTLQDIATSLRLLVLELLTWIRLQLSIADVARDLIVETRVLIGLLIVICRRVIGILDWCNDWYQSWVYAIMTIRLWPVMEMVTG